MRRALHILDAGGWGWQGGRLVADGLADEAASLCALAVAARETLGESRVLILGPAWFVRRAAGLGLRADSAACPPLGRPEFAARIIRHGTAAARANVVCCWSRACERAALLGMGQKAPIVRVRLRREKPRGAMTESVRRAEVAPAELADPPVLPTAPAGARAAARQRLGIADGEVAVLLVGDGPQASAVRFAFTLGLCRQAGDPAVGLLPAWSDQLERAERFHHKFAHEVRLIDFEQPRRDILPAADLAVWVGAGRTATWLPGGSPSRIAAAQCLAAGIPLIAPRRAGLEDLYPPEAAAACLAECGMPPELARRLIPLVEDPARARSIGAACQAHIRAKNGTERYIRALAEAFDSAATTGPWLEVVAQLTGRPGVYA